jgi:CO/xanthine dehydrogenase FAD-binding subunit
MRPFLYQRATDPSVAVQTLAAAADNNPLTQASVQPLAGGTTLIDLMKLDVMRPATIVDINPLEGAWSTIDFEGGNLRLGALARMSDVAANPQIQRDYPVVADSLKLAASAQLRNMASLGGNVLQRTRCTYFRVLSLPARRPQMYHASRGRFFGGSRPPATDLKNSTSSGVIGDAVVAFKTERQPFQLEPRNHGSNRSGESMAWIMVGTPATPTLLGLVTRPSPLQNRTARRTGFETPPRRRPPGPDRRAPPHGGPSFRSAPARCCLGFRP